MDYYDRFFQDEQLQREQSNQAAYDDYLNQQPEYSLEKYRQMIAEVRAELEAAKLKLKEYDVSTSGANVLEIGYEDGRNGRQPRMPHFLNYRIHWERGFKEYLASGKFWEQVQENLIEVPF